MITLLANTQFFIFLKPIKKKKKKVFNLLLPLYFLGQYGGLPKSHPAMIKAGAAVPKHKKSELKRPEQILKSRVADEKKRKNGVRKTKKKNRPRK
jgi:hypothetical protein